MQEILSDLNFYAWGVCQERFTSNSPYIAAHFGIGREVKQSDTETFTYYGKFLYSHTFSDNINLTSGEDYYLSSVNSLRIKLGFREGWEINPQNKFYAIHDGLRTDSFGKNRGLTGRFGVNWYY
ncbi:MAG: hypothetical protein IJQ16_07080 [Selenomonadaceae bacterium]|nr:hypothetical protein [Selenomonadaceae bacterium]